MTNLSGLSTNQLLGMYQQLSGPSSQPLLLEPNFSQFLQPQYGQQQGYGQMGYGQIGQQGYYPSGQYPQQPQQGPLYQLRSSGQVVSFFSPQAQQDFYQTTYQEIVSKSVMALQQNADPLQGLNQYMQILQGELMRPQDQAVTLANQIKLKALQDAYQAVMQEKQKMAVLSGSGPQGGLGFGGLASMFGPPIGSPGTPGGPPLFGQSGGFGQGGLSGMFGPPIGSPGTPGGPPLFGQAGGFGQGGLSGMFGPPIGSPGTPGGPPLYGQPQYGGFGQTQFAGGFPQQPQFGGYGQPQFGGYPQQPQYGGFGQSQFAGGFPQQPQGGIPPQYYGAPQQMGGLTTPQQVGFTQTTGNPFFPFTIAG